MPHQRNEGSRSTLGTMPIRTVPWGVTGATQAAALARSRSRTPLPRASCGPRPFAHVLRGSPGSGAWTSGRWIRLLAQAFAVAEAAVRPRQDPDAYSQAATGYVNVPARPEISLRAPHPSCPSTMKSCVLKWVPAYGGYPRFLATQRCPPHERRTSRRTSHRKSAPAVPASRLQPRMVANGRWPLTRSASTSANARVKRGSPEKARVAVHQTRERLVRADRAIISLGTVIVARSKRNFSRSLCVPAAYQAGLGQCYDQPPVRNWSTRHCSVLGYDVERRRSKRLVVCTLASSPE